MNLLSRTLFLATLAIPAAGLLSGCGSSVPTSQSAAVADRVLTGRAMGGQQPIAGATLQLYAVNTAAGADGSAATPLLGTVTSSDGSGQRNANANAGNAFNTLSAGSFTITGAYTCPSAGTPVYLTASGGNPGLTSGSTVNNTASQLMVALGSCGNLPSQSFVSINEVTTAGTVAALYPYMTAYNAVGSTAAHASALSAAFTTAAEYINSSTGLGPGPSLPSGMYASTNELYALADSVATCVNTAGYTPGDGSACDQLFVAATPASTGVAPTNTVTALLDIRNNPTQNVGTIFNLASGVVPFAPIPSTAPVDWTLPILPQPGTPIFSVPSGSYNAVQSLTLSDSDPTAVIYYTTDGTTPTASSAVWSGAISISASETVSAVAIESGRLSSSVGSATYSVLLPEAGADLKLLHASGTSIVNSSGTPVVFKGVNLGGWYVMESYMSPTDSAGTYADEYSMLTELTARSTEAQAESLVNTYIQNWITPADITSIAAAGFNEVRIPVWWGQFYKLGAYPTTGDPNAYLRSDAFTYLDTIIAACAQNNIYVVLDMHGAFGGQSGNPDTGHAGDNTYFSNANNQAATVAMWKMIAAHYAASPYRGTVAGFDLLNEPTGILGSGTTGGVTVAQVAPVYNALYQAIRQADPNRMIIMESTFWTANQWAYSNLPNPTSNSYGYVWNNVVYSTHMYPGSSDTAAQVESAADTQKSRFATITASGYNVPVYVGEFQAYNTGTAAWQYVESDLDGDGISWSFWAYKAINGAAPNYWGLYDPTTSSSVTRPNIQYNSFTLIQTDWTDVTTGNYFTQNSTVIPNQAY